MHSASASLGFQGTRCHNHAVLRHGSMWVVLSWPRRLWVIVRGHWKRASRDECGEGCTLAGRPEGDLQANSMYKRLDPTHLEWEDQGSVRLQYRTPTATHRCDRGSTCCEPRSESKCPPGRSTALLNAPSLPSLCTTQPVHDSDGPSSLESGTLCAHVALPEPMTP